jgi:flagellar basal-body rod modification protein FlgD
MSVDPITALQTATQTGTASGAGTISQANSGALEQEFLTLLVAQLQAQDPLNPTDPSQFTSQLATFSSLQQLVGMNDKMDQQIQLQNVSIGTAAASFVGKYAEVKSDSVTLKAGKADEIRYTLSAPSAQTQIKILDASGGLVRTVSLGAQNSGTNTFQWDGLTDLGTPAPDGAYKFEITAQSADGKPVALETSIVSRITGVRFDNGAVLLQINGQDHPLSDLFSISEIAPAAPAPTTAPPGSGAPQPDPLPQPA